MRVFIHTGGAGGVMVTVLENEHVKPSQFAFHIMPVPLGKVSTYLFSQQV